MYQLLVYIFNIETFMNKYNPNSLRIILPKLDCHEKMYFLIDHF